MNSIKYFLVCIIFLASSALSADSEQPIIGRVINADTGKPIRDVFVIAKWIHHGSDGYGSRTSCPHMEVVKTNSDGVYIIPTGHWGARPDVVATYYPGFDETEEPRGAKNKAADEALRFKEIRPRSSSSGMPSYAWYASLRTCDTADQYATLAGLYQAIDNELMTTYADVSPYPPNSFMRTLRKPDNATRSDHVPGDGK